MLAKLGTKDRDRGHIGYRDSKLTRILKPSLSGNARMACICCISPAMKFSEESKFTLDFASRTMLVTTNAKVNRTVESERSYVTPKKPKATSSHVDIDLLHKELAAKTEEAAGLAAKLQVAEEKLKHEREESEVLRTAKQELEDQVTLQKADKEFALSECQANATEKDSVIASLLDEQKRQTDKIQSLQEAIVEASQGQLAEKELGNVAKTLMEPVDCHQEVEEQSTFLMSGSTKKATSLSSASEAQMETANGEEEDSMEEGDASGDNDVKFDDVGVDEDSLSSTDSVWSSNASRKETMRNFDGDDDADFGGGDDNFDFSEDNARPKTCNKRERCTTARCNKEARVDPDGSALCMGCAGIRQNRAEGCEDRKLCDDPGCTTYARKSGKCRSHGG